MSRAIKDSKTYFYAVIGLVVVGVAWASYAFFFAGNSPYMARYFPHSVQIYVEAPDIPDAYGSLSEIDFLKKKAKEKFNLEEMADDLAKKLELQKEDAKKILASLSSMALAIEKREKKREQKAVVIKFSDLSALETLLASSRFEKKGKVEDIGVKYKGKSKKKRGYTFPLRVPFLGTNPSLILVRSESLLIAGDMPLMKKIVKVIKGEEKSLEESDSYIRASEHFHSSPHLAGYVNLKKLFGSEKKAPPAMKKLKRIAFSSQIHSGGVRMELAYSMDREIMPEAELLTQRVSFDLANRFPQGTFMALEVASKFNTDDPQEWEKKYLAYLEKQSEGLPRRPGGTVEDIKEFKREMEKETGLSISHVFAALGDQAALGLVLNTSIEDPEKKRFWELGAVVSMIKIKEKGAAQKITNALRKELQKKNFLEKTEVTDRGWKGQMVFHSRTRIRARKKGVKMRSGQPPVHLRVHYLEGLLVLGIGDEKTIEKAVESAGGKGKSLGDDPTFSKVMSDYDDSALARMYIDLALPLQFGDQMKSKRIKEKPGDYVNLKGEMRPVGATLFDYYVEDGEATMTVKSNNGISLISVSAAVVLPSLMVGPGTVSNETSAMGMMRTIFSAQQQFYILRKGGSRRYARSLAELAKHNFISPPRRTSGGWYIKSGYKFKVEFNDDTPTQFKAWAIPLNLSAGERAFYVDNSGRITYNFYWKKGTKPTEKSKRLD